MTPGTIINVSGSCNASAGLTIAEIRWTYGGQHISGESSFTWLVSQGGTLTLTCTDSAGQVSGRVSRAIGIEAATPTQTETPTPTPADTATPTATPTPTSAVGDLYVRTDGDDTNCNGTANAAYPGSGSGLACAFASLPAAVTNAVAGNTVVLAAGTYALTSDLTVTTANLHFIGDPGASQIGPGSNPPVIDLTPAGSNGRLLLNASGIILEGFEVVPGGSFNSSTGAISGQGYKPVLRVGGGSTGITVRHNTVRGGGRSPGYVSGARGGTGGDGGSGGAGGSKGKTETLSLWDPATGERYLIIRGERDEVRSLSFSNDGGRLAMGNEDGQIRIWKVRAELN